MEHGLALTVGRTTKENMTLEGDGRSQSRGDLGAERPGFLLWFILGERVMQEGDMALLKKQTVVAETSRGCGFLKFPQGPDEPRESPVPFQLHGM